jgi:hypothetical protein
MSTKRRLRSMKPLLSKAGPRRRTLCQLIQEIEPPPFWAIQSPANPLPAYYQYEGISTHFPLVEVPRQKLLRTKLTLSKQVRPRVRCCGSTWLSA